MLKNKIVEDFSKMIDNLEKTFKKLLNKIKTKGGENYV